MTDAAFENHLMQDGEEILGAYCWEKIEHIEELSIQYWTLRRLNSRQETILAQIKESEEILAEVQKKKASEADHSKGLEEVLIDERITLCESIEEANRSRDILMTEALRTKNRHAALKMKVKVLQEEEDLHENSEIRKTRRELATLRETFADSKDKLDVIEEELAVHENQLNQVKGKINLESDSINGTNEVFLLISKANQNITKHKSEMGLLKEEQSQLFRDVGRFLNLNSKREDCRKACEQHKGIQQQTYLLKNSIELNQKLSEKIGR